MTTEILRGDAGRELRAWQGLRLDPRTKMVMTIAVGVVLTAGGYGGLMAYIRPALAVMPLLLLLFSKRWGAAIFYAAAFASAYLIELFMLTRAFGILNFILLASAGIFARFMPGIMMGYFLVSTTTVSEFMAAMYKMHVTEKLTIPLSVMFRFFPTVREEYAAIGDAMRMRGVTLAGGKPLKMLEYRLVPMMMCCLKIGEELSAAALTRGLGSPRKRVNICKIGFHAQDTAFLLVSVFCLAAYLHWLITS
jgi:energy-coupling factor transport system permease protein